MCVDFLKATYYFCLIYLPFILGKPPNVHGYKVHVLTFQRPFSLEWKQNTSVQGRLMDLQVVPHGNGHSHLHAFTLHTGFC